MTEPTIQPIEILLEAACCYDGHLVEVGRIQWTFDGGTMLAVRRGFRE